MRSYRCLLFVVLLVAPLAVVPSASAAAITVRIDDEGGTGGLDIDVDGEHWLMCYATDTSPSDDIVFSRTADKGETFSVFRKVIRSVTSVNSGSCDLHVLGPDHYLAVSSGGGSQLNVHETTTGGSFWATTATEPSGGPTIKTQARLWVHNATTWAVAAKGAGTNPGIWVWQTADSGATWSAAVQVTTSTPDMDLAVLRTDFNQWAVMTSAAAYMSADAGATWTAAISFQFSFSDAWDVEANTTFSTMARIVSPSDPAEERMHLISWTTTPAALSVGPAFYETTSGGDIENIRYADSALGIVFALTETVAGITVLGGDFGLSTTDETSTSGSAVGALDGEAALVVPLGGLDLTYLGEGFFDAAAVSDTFAGITGMSVDGTGTTVVIRRDSGANVTTLSGYSLVTSNTFATPLCGLSYGIDALKRNDDLFVSFVDCKAGGDVEFLRIRDGNLNAANFPSGCGDECEDDVEDKGFLSDIAVPDDLNEMGTISTTPYSFDRFRPGGFNDATASWTFSDFSGRIGVFAVTYNNVGSDFSDTARTVIDSSTFPEVGQFCSWFTGEKDLITGVTSNGPTSVFEANVDVTGGLGQAKRPDATIGSFFTGGPGIAQGIAVACAEEKLAVIAGGCQLTVLDIVGSVTQLWTQTLADCVPRGLAMSGDGNFVAYRDGTQVLVVHAGNGTLAATIDEPSPTIRDMAIDRTGGNLWLATATNVYRYEIANATCQANCSIFADDFGDPFTGAPGAGTDPQNDGICPGGASGFFGADLCRGIDTDGDGTVDINGDIFGWLIGGMFVFALTFGVAGIKWWLAPGGMSLGVLIAVGFGLWPLYTTALIALALIGGIVLYFARGR